MKQKKFIEVHDNIFHPDLVNQLEELILMGKNPNFKFNYRPNLATANSNEYFPGFVHVFGENLEDTKSPFSFILFNILYNFCSIKNIAVLNVEASRVFLQTPSPKPSLSKIHTDLNTPHWVCLYYLNDSEGDTVFFEDDGVTEIKRVSPKKGRMVFFDGLIKHAATSPSKTPRSVINIAFTGESLG